LTGFTVERTANGIEFRWPAVPGTSYRVEYRDEGGDELWRETGIEVRASDTTGRALLAPDLNVPLRYFRLKRN
jgi:hypothetical protein